MRYDGLYNYFEINSFCKSERMCTEYFMTEIDKCKKKKKNVIALLVAAVLRITGR